MNDPLDPMNPTTLRAAREARGLNLTDLARASGVLVTTILRIETNGTDPRTIQTWAPLVAALNTVPLVGAPVAEAAQ